MERLSVELTLYRAARVLAGVLQSRGDAVHGQQQELLEAPAIGIQRVAAAQSAQRAKLQMTERIDVWIAQLDGPRKHAAVLEQTRLTGDRKDPLDGAVVFRKNQLGDARLAAKAQIFGRHEPIGLGQTHLRVV